MSVFIAALFAIARTWMQPKCPSMEEQINKTWYVYTTEYYSAIKKNEMMPCTATWMDLKIVILNEEKDKYHMILLICGILPPKNGIKEPVYKIAIESQMQKTNLQEIPCESSG